MSHSRYLPRYRTRKAAGALLFTFSLLFHAFKIDDLGVERPSCIASNSIQSPLFLDHRLRHQNHLRPTLVYFPFATTLVSHHGRRREASKLPSDWRSYFLRTLILSPTMTSSSHTIKTVWSTIEKFLDLPSTIAVSGTCRALHDEIIDHDTQKVKVSHFIVEAYSDKHPWARIPLYLPCALNVIHFPSVRQMRLTFPSICKSLRSINEVETEVEVDFEDVTASCFPIFVTQLAHASNLECLQLFLGGIIGNITDDDDEDTTMNFEPLILLFGRNLARCKKLKELSICFTGNYFPSGMRELMQALTPTLIKQGNVMREIEFSIENWDAGDDFEETDMPLHTVAVNFFLAILSCPDLQLLGVNVPHSSRLTNALLDAANQIAPQKHQSKKQKIWVGSALQRLSLELYGMYDKGGVVRMVDDDDPYLEGAGMLLEHFSECTQIQEISLGMPSYAWKVYLDKVTSLLNGKPLSTLSFTFGSYKDHDEKVLGLINKLVMNKESNKCKIADLQLHSLKNVNGKHFFELVQDIINAGGDFEEFYVYDSNDIDQILCEYLKAEDIPVKTIVDVNYFHMRHDENLTVVKGI